MTVALGISGDGPSNSTARAVIRRHGGTIVESRDYAFEWAMVVEFDQVPPTFLDELAAETKADPYTTQAAVRELPRTRRGIM